MVHVIFKGDGWASKGSRGSNSSARRSFSVSPEGKLYERIGNGKLTDMDIQDIQKKGDSKMIEALEKKAEECRRNKNDLEDKLGIKDKRLFDGVDNDGNLYKDIPLKL